MDEEFSWVDGGRRALWTKSLSQEHECVLAVCQPAGVQEPWPGGPHVGGPHFNSVIVQIPPL